MTDLLPDGVYLDLDAEEYFPQGLGSSDLITLHFRREGWWWQSPFNPDYKRPSRAALTYGTALHAILLEDVAAYEERFAIVPDKPAMAVETVPEMRQALIENGFRMAGTSAWRASDWALAMRYNIPEVPCWPNILEDFETQAGDRLRVTAMEDRMLRFMREVAISPGRSDNAEIRYLFAQGAGRPPLAEVSVLKTLPNGIRRRWRIDRMFPAFDLDLKSLGNWSGRPLEFETGEVIARNGYDIQRADYLEARQAAYQFIQDGFRVHGGTIDQRAWLAKFPEEFPTWDWVWLFYQKPDPKGRAPVIFPVLDETYRPIEGRDWSGETWTEHIPSTILTHGLSKKAAALDLYQRCVADFGFDQPWARVDRLHYTDEGMDPRIILPHYLAHERPIHESAYPQEDPAHG